MRANIFVLFLVLLISGCGGGSSGANGPDPFNPGTDPVIGLSLQLLDANCNSVSENTFTTDDTICVQATLTSDGSVSSGEVVSFSIDSDIGSLSASTALTDASGVAQITLTSTDSTVGAATVTATFGTTTANQNFEFTSGTPTATTTLSVIILDANCLPVAEPVFATDQSICVQATLTADATPLAGELITFSLGAEIGTLENNTALTNASGIAEVIISNSAATTGATAVTATFGDISGSANYAYETAGAGGTEQLSIAILNAQCQADDQSFATNETICVQATLTNSGAPFSNEIVSFALSSELGNLSATTALTNASGIAEVSITNAEASVGAASVTASFDTLSATENYEFVAIDEAVTTSPTISVAVIDTNNQVSGFQAGQEVVARSTVLDAEDQPVSGIIVNFSIQGEGPRLSPATALTNTQGIAQVNIETTESDLGAYSLQAQTSVSDLAITNSVNFEVRSAGAVVDSITRFGHFNADGVFVEGIIGSSIADENSDVIISAGATTGFDVALVDEEDNRIAAPTPITFSTNCVTNGEATIDETVTTINGVASATFEDLSCAGATGNTDQIIASAVINNVTTTITRELTIQPEGIGSISFISATPDSIVLRGTGGQGNASVSTLLFQVNGALGNPLAQQEVNFALNATAGGLTLDPASGLTNSSGQVSTRVTAGTIPTPVRVTASITTNDGESVQTQSDLLTVNTGLPDQNSMTIGATNLTPEAFNISGQQVTIIARMADAFNNPVPNGTTVNFTTESGIIDSSCRTGEDNEGNLDLTGPDTGTCSVTWTSASPRPEDHRNTILAWADGHETLFDANGNNAYDDTDGDPIFDNSDSGFGVSQYGETGFVDMSEAWLDIDEDGFRDGFEPFIPFNDNGQFDAADGLFNGPQCNSDSRCGEQRSIHIRRALVLITSSSNAYWRVYVNSTDSLSNIIATNDPDITVTNGNVVDGAYQLADGDSATFTLVYYDTAGQVLPSGTQLGTLDPEGNISTVIDTVDNSIQPDIDGLPGDVRLVASVTNSENVNDVDDTGSESFSFAIDAPSGRRTTVSFTVDRVAP